MFTLKKNFELAVSFIIVLFAVCLIGCGTTSNICPAPDDQWSVICDLATDIGTTPEEMHLALQIINVGALQAKLYTAQEALDFINELIADLKNIKRSITYAEALDYINDKYQVLPPEVQTVFVLANPANFATRVIKNPLSEYDIKLLIAHLEKQRAIVEVYL